MRVIHEKIEHVGTMLMVAILILAVLSLPIWFIWIVMMFLDWVSNA